MTRGGERAAALRAESWGDGRNHEIDILRFVFALIIVLHHTRYLLGDEHCLFLGGSLGVEFFFLVSGFLLAASAMKETAPGTAVFLRHKLRAVLPEFLPAWLLGFFFVVRARSLSPRGAAALFVDDIWELTLLKMTGLFTGGIDGVIWYVSAMLLCMAVLYPLLRKYRDSMLRVGALLAALVLLGYLCRNFAHPRDPAVWLGFCYKGVVRCMAELCLGASLYLPAVRLRSLRLSAAGRGLAGLCKWSCYLASIRYMFLAKPSNRDYFYILLLCAAVLLSFAVPCGSGARRMDRASVFLAKLSTALYFSHIYFAQNLNALLPASMRGGERTAVYLACSFAAAFLVMWLASLLRRHSAAIRRALGKLLLAQA